MASEIDVRRRPNNGYALYEDVRQNFRITKAEIEALQASAGGDTYVHSQDTPLTTWSITHNLGKRPSVTVVDSGNTVVFGEVNYVDDNNVTVTFSAGFSGKAYLN